MMQFFVQGPVKKKCPLTFFPMPVFLGYQSEQLVQFPGEKWIEAIIPDAHSRLIRWANPSPGNCM